LRGLFFCLIFFSLLGPEKEKEREELIRLPRTYKHWLAVSGFAEYEPDPDYQHAPEEVYEQFLDLKFGIRIHWGIYTVMGLIDTSWPFLFLPSEQKQAYQEAYKTWNPSGFDAKQWLDFFQRAGVRIFAFTAKHHEGFSMYDTRARVVRRVRWIGEGAPKIEKCNLAYSIMESAFARDVVRELVDEAHRRGVWVDLYFSLPDWYDADFRPYGFHPLSCWKKYFHPVKYGWIPNKRLELFPLFAHRLERFDPVYNWRSWCKEVAFPRFAPAPGEEEKQRMMARLRTQLLELAVKYQPEMLCLDLWLGGEVWLELKQIIKEVRRAHPRVMFRVRGIGNYGDYFTPERAIPGRRKKTIMTWMVIYPLARSFAYDPDPAQYKGARWMIHNLIDVVSKGGVFMPAIGPDAEGRFHPEAVQQFEEVGRWLEINGEAIYYTRPWKYWREGNEIRFTRSKDKKYVYALVLGELKKEFRSRYLSPLAGSEIYLLGYPKPLKWKRQEGELVVEIPKQVVLNPPCSYAWVLKLKVGQ